MQVTILRVYLVEFARHFILQVVDAAATAQWIQRLIVGSDGLPAITTAARVRPKPECFLNISFSSTGLAIMGLSSAELATFDKETSISPGGIAIANDPSFGTLAFCDSCLSDGNGHEWTSSAN